MEVILLKDVKNLGKASEVAEVSDGYANNYLFKNDLATPKTKESNKKLQAQLKREKETHDELHKRALIDKKKLESQVFKFSIKANNGQIFGRVTTKQMAESISLSGIEVNKKMIKSDAIAHLGTEIINVELTKEVVAQVKIQIEGE